MIQIDGSQGEGGGQIIRSSLALSAITGTPFTIENIRAKRKKSGLLRQHLTAVQAAVKICGAEVDGAELNSKRLVFEPGPLCPGEYSFRIGSAGSSTLVAQTVLSALMLARGPSQIHVEGGTHNMKAPPFNFLEKAYLPLVSKMGPELQATLHAYGFYPAGGGEIQINVKPVEKLKGMELMERGGQPEISVLAIVSGIDASVAERELDTIRRKASWPIASLKTKVVENPRGPGNVVIIQIASHNVVEICTGFGQKGIRAEQVARKVFRQAQAYLNSAAPVGEFLADQLMLPMGLAARSGQTSRFRTTHLSEHSRTHKAVLEKFLDIEIQFETQSDFVDVTIG